MVVALGGGVVGWGTGDALDLAPLVLVLTDRAQSAAPIRAVVILAGGAVHWKPNTI